MDNGPRLSVPPLPLVILVCDAIYRDSTSGKLTLLGLFSNLMAREVPVIHPLLMVYLAFTDANGQVPLRVQIVDANEEHEPIATMESVAIITDPRMVAEVPIAFPGVTFPEFGEYRVQVFACNEFLTERRILVMPPPGSPEGEDNADHADT